MSRLHVERNVSHTRYSDSKFLFWIPESERSRFAMYLGLIFCVRVSTKTNDLSLFFKHLLYSVKVVLTHTTKRHSAFRTLSLADSDNGEYL